MTKIFITLISFNNNKATLECLESLEKLAKDNLSLNVVVIDNASKENFKIDKTYKNFEIKLLRSEENLGFSGGQNMGIRYSLQNGADFVVILNNDTIVDKNLIVELYKGFEKGIGIVAPKIYFAKGYEFHKDRYSQQDLGKVIWYAGGILDLRNVIGKHRGVDEVDVGQFDKALDTDSATGCCMMIARETLSDVGFFDDRYFLYYEDADLSMRTKKAGFRILFQPKAILWHKNAASAGGSGSPLQDYYITRNRLTFGFTYTTFRTKIALFRESIKILLNGRKWQKQGVKDFYFKNLGKGSFAKI